jgi:hypothetical protein
MLKTVMGGRKYRLQMPMVESTEGRRQNLLTDKCIMDGWADRQKEDVQMSGINEWMDEQKTGERQEDNLWTK